jgi:hypothetical protein
VAGPYSYLALPKASINASGKIAATYLIFDAINDEMYVQGSHLDPTNWDLPQDLNIPDAISVAPVTFGSDDTAHVAWTNKDPDTGDWSLEMTSGIEGESWDLATSRPTTNGVEVIDFALNPVTNEGFLFTFDENGPDDYIGIVQAIPVTATLNNTITFELLDKTYGDTLFHLGANASSGLSVTYSVLQGNSLVSLSGDEFTLLGAGLVEIEANQGGDSSYPSASPVRQSFNINKALLTVTADDKDKSYGDSNPTFTASFSDFVNGEDESVLTGAPDFNIDPSPVTDVGSYTIVMSQGDLAADNYNFHFVNGTLTVEQADPSLTFNSI